MLSLALTLAASPVALADSWGEPISRPDKRFIVLRSYGNDAVLDAETGLVWERSPSTATFTWQGAPSHCNLLVVGNRRGWRLPAVQELASLQDPSGASNPILPAGHPFSGVQPATYWSATSWAADPAFAWDVNFAVGGTVNFFVKSFSLSAWCVRGGQGVDPQ